MAPQLYLVTPPDADPERFGRTLMGVLNGPAVAALLLRRGSLDEPAFVRLATQLVEIGQAAGAAVLLEDDIALVRRTGADGVHVTSGGIEALRAAIAALKPDGIVGVGNIATRHDAMRFGELDVDYVMFGPLEGAAAPAALELAQWWAETFEVPAVFSDPAAQSRADGVEFVALSDSIWHAPDPAAALATAARALEEPA